jgi:hypothetical protein
MINNPERDYQFELIRKFDVITFNLDIIKAIPESEYRQYGMRWKRMPEEDEQFQVRRVSYTRSGTMLILPMSLKYPNSNPMARGNCHASLIRRILWYDGGNGKMINKDGWSSHWQDSKCVANIFIAQSMNAELFKDWNHQYYMKFIKSGDNGQMVILPYNKKTLNDMGLNMSEV